jgi:hypothetical protein
LSPEEQDPPVHRISRPEDRERILAEALAHAEEQEERHRIRYPDDPRRGRWKSPVALGILVIAVLIAAFPPRWLASQPLPVPTPAQLGRGLRIALYVQAGEIEAFRAREGHLPRSLDEVDARFDDLLFVRSSGRVFQLVGRAPDGGTLVFDSARPGPDLDRDAASWLGVGER